LQAIFGQSRRWEPIGWLPSKIWILDLAGRFEEETLALEPHDWELELTYEFTTGSESKARWFTSLKHTLEERRNPSLDHYWA